MSLPGVSVRNSTRDGPSPRVKRIVRAVWIGSLVIGTINVCLLILIATVFGDHPNTRSMVAPWFVLGIVTGPATTTFGYLIVTQRRERVIGFLLLGIGTGMIVNFTFADLYGSLSYQILDHPLPFAKEATWFSYAVLDPAIHLRSLLFLLFPVGALLSRWWRPLAILVILQASVHGFAMLFGNTPYTFPFGTWEFFPKAFAVITPAVGPIETAHRLAETAQGWLVPACLLAMVVRFRGAALVERRQIAWVFAGGVLSWVFLTFPRAVGALFGTTPNPPECDVCIPWVFSLGHAFLPVAVGVAVFRHHLWRTDVVVNKALVYGSLAGFIGGSYIAVVVGLGTLLGTAGEPNVWLSILATALVAIGFQPVRERVQRLANRLVYGERATPYETLSAFSRRIEGAISLEQVLPRMAEAAARGVAAERGYVRLLMGDREERTAAWPADSASEEFDLTVPVEHQGEMLGDISVAKAQGDPLTREQERLLRDLASQAGLAMRNVRLTEELQERLRKIRAQSAELRASRARIVAAGDAERKRVERNLHDGAQQRLLTLALQLRMLSDMYGEDAPRAVKDLAAKAEAEASAALEELRELAQGLHPSILADEGLRPAIEFIAERSPLPVDIDVPSGRYPEQVEAAAYFMVAEALANVVKYAQASRATVRVESEDGLLRVEVADDGIGGADTSRGSGLRGLEDRIAATGGALEISSPPDVGTTLVATLSLAEPR